MRFRLYNEDELIGCSELEHADESMGFRVGIFYPAEGYAPLEPIFREFSMVRFDEHWTEHQTRDPDKLQQLRARRAQLQPIVDRFQLRLKTEDGQPIGTAYICIEDFYEELGEQGREVTIQVDDYTTYEQFFAGNCGLVLTCAPHPALRAPLSPQKARGEGPNHKQLGSLARPLSSRCCWRGVAEGRGEAPKPCA